MESNGLLSLALVVINIIISYKGFKDYGFFQRYSFNIAQLRLRKDYIRLVSSGFLHGGWMHLIFNMAALYSFGSVLEQSVGGIRFGIIYFASLVLGNMLSYFVHKNKADYTSIGASGAVSGVVFAAIALYPDMQMGLLFIPIRLPGWIFGLLYVLYSIFGMRGQRDNIGHEAHLGGGMSGLLILLAMCPEVLSHNLLPILTMLVPAAVFLYFVFTRPGFLLLDKPFGKHDEGHTIEDRYNASRRMKELELDRLLDKIHKHGIESLSKKEKERLEELSRVK